MCLLNFWVVVGFGLVGVVHLAGHPRCQRSECRSLLQMTLAVKHQYRLVMKSEHGIRTYVDASPLFPRVPKRADDF